MFNKLKSLFSKPEVKAPEPKTKKSKPKLTPKEAATAAGEPYIEVVSFDLDPNDPHNGSVEFDWNDKFITNLVRAGYKIKDTDTDADLIDRWWATICRNTVMELYEQQAADLVDREEEAGPFTRKYNYRDLGNNRSEVS